MSLCLLNIGLPNFQVKSGLRVEGESPGSTLESCLKPDEHGFLHPFGDPRIRNIATSRAFVTGLSLEKALLQSTARLGELSPASNETAV